MPFEESSFTNCDTFALLMNWAQFLMLLKHKTFLLSPYAIARQHPNRTMYHKVISSYPQSKQLCCTTRLPLRAQSSSCLTRSQRFTFAWPECLPASFSQPVQRSKKRTLKDESQNTRTSQHRLPAPIRLYVVIKHAFDLKCLQARNSSTLVSRMVQKVGGVG